MPINIMPIVRKVTITGNNFEFSFIEDQTEYAIDLIEAGCNGLDETNVYDYFSEGEFKDEEVNELNGKHFLFGFLEALDQSERCPDTLHTYKGKLKFKISIVDANEKESN